MAREGSVSQVWPHHEDGTHPHSHRSLWPLALDPEVSSSHEHLAPWGMMMMMVMMIALIVLNSPRHPVGQGLYYTHFTDKKLKAREATKRQQSRGFSLTWTWLVSAFSLGY